MFKPVDVRIREYQIQVEEELLPHYLGWDGVTISREGRDREGNPARLVKIIGHRVYTGGCTTPCRRPMTECAIILYNEDQDQVFSKKVSPTCKSVEDALWWLEASQVVRAREIGELVYRQGDVYFFEQSRMNLRAIEDSRHEVEKINGKMIIHHPNHPDLILNGNKKYKAVLQRSLRGDKGD